MTTPDDLTSTRAHAHRLVEAEFLVGNKDSILSALEGRDREIEALRARVGWEVAERNREAGARNVATAVDLNVIEARLNAAREWLASDHTAPHVWPEGASFEGGERCLRCGSTVPAGVCLSSRTMQFLDARGLLRDANDDLRTLLAEVRRLTADRDRWRVSCERAASDENDNAADLERVTKERDEARTALATTRDVARVEVAALRELLTERQEAARLDGARAMREALAPFAAYAGVYTDDAPDDAIVLRHVGATATRTITIGDFRRALDPAAVVGSGS